LRGFRGSRYLPLEFIWFAGSIKVAVNALVTGAGGFLGLAVVRDLTARGERVRAVARRRNPELETLEPEIVLGDLRKPDFVDAACQGVDVVFHVAGVAGIWGPWSHYYSNNVLATQNVLAACRRHSVAKLVYTSSPSVTFDGSAQEGVDESAPYARRWLCHYAHTKALAEQAVLAASDRSLATCALRPHLIWGPGDRQLVPRILDRARSGKLRRVGDGRNLIDNIYVDNAAEAHLAAAAALEPEGPVAGQAYFLSQGEPVNCWTWIDELVELAGLPRVRRKLSLNTAWTVGAALELGYAALRLHSEPPMTRFLAAQLGRSHYFDISRARRDFKYRPAVSTAEGMNRLAKSMGVGI